MISFAVTDAGDGLFVMSDRELLQRLVPERLHGRAFGVLDSVEAWAFAGAVVAAARSPWPSAAASRSQSPAP